MFLTLLHSQGPQPIPDDGIVYLGGGGNVYHHHRVLHEKDKKIKEAMRLEAKIEEMAKAVEFGQQEMPVFTEPQRQKIKLLTNRDVVLYYHSPELLAALAAEIRTIIEGYRAEIREIERQKFVQDEEHALVLLMTVH